VIERAKSKHAAPGLDAIAEEGATPSLRVEPPVVVVVNEVADGIAAKKKLVSQLPYMVRECVWGGVGGGVGWGGGRVCVG
jgi:hypothetical protein